MTTLRRRGFPATLCTLINAEVVHGIPSKKRRLAEGDIIGIDCGAIVDGYYGDHAITFAVGLITEEAQRLIDTTREALYVGIAQAKIGNYLSDISYAIQVFQDAMLANEAGYVIGLPNCPLGKLYGELPCRDVRLGTRVSGLRVASHPRASAPR